jgi:energy-converting hydrogenase Eha subunit E
MLFLIFNIDHLVAVLTFADVSAAIGLVKVDAINRK